MADLVSLPPLKTWPIYRVKKKYEIPFSSSLPCACTKGLTFYLTKAQGHGSHLPFQNRRLLDWFLSLMLCWQIIHYLIFRFFHIGYFSHVFLMCFSYVPSCLFAWHRLVSTPNKSCGSNPHVPFYSNTSRSNPFHHLCQSIVYKCSSV